MTSLSDSTSTTLTGASDNELDERTFVYIVFDKPFNKVPSVTVSTWMSYDGGKWFFPNEIISVSKTGFTVSIRNNYTGNNIQTNVDWSAVGEAVIEPNVARLNGEWNTTCTSSNRYFGGTIIFETPFVEIPVVTLNCSNNQSYMEYSITDITRTSFSWTLNFTAATGSAAVTFYWVAEASAFAREGSTAVTLSGTFTRNCNSATNYKTTIEFEKPFNEVPDIICSCSNGLFNPDVYDVNESGVTFSYGYGTSPGTNYGELTFTWVASANGWAEDVIKTYDILDERMSGIEDRLNNYNPAVVLSGNFTATINSQDSVHKIIEFNPAFNEIPTVTAGFAQKPYCNCYIEEITQGYVKIRCANESSSVATNTLIEWAATASGFANDPVV